MYKIFFLELWMLEHINFNADSKLCAFDKALKV